MKISKKLFIIIACVIVFLVIGCIPKKEIYKDGFGYVYESKAILYHKLEYDTLNYNGKHIRVFPFNWISPMEYSDYLRN